MRREKKFVVYCIDSCGEIQKQKDRTFVIIEGSENVVEYLSENSLRAVPGPVSRLMDAE